jgi:hypothetical protein
MICPNPDPQGSHGCRPSVNLDHSQEYERCMKIERRDFLKTVAAAGTLHVGGDPNNSFTTINRKDLVSRHNPVLRKPDPLSPLSVGNGEFAFTADITGLQTFPALYRDSMPLCTLAQWGWHTIPPAPGLDPGHFRFAGYDTHGRQVGYPTSSEGQEELFDWLRENPHRLHLGQIGLRIISSTGNREIQPEELTNIQQSLDLWTGILTSRFEVAGHPVLVRTSIHPELDLLAAAVESPLLRQGQLAIRFAFPYGSPGMQAADWEQPARHTSILTTPAARRADIERILDEFRYFVAIGWNGEASLISEKEHCFLLVPKGQRPGIEFVAAFGPRRAFNSLPDTQAVFKASAANQQRFWNSGGVVELAGSRDRRASELERRIVLSQYLTAIQCAGSLPPQESGLTVNTWYGKFHLEMHWWHAAHFALWNRVGLLEKSLGWYASILPSARKTAAGQGYAGARWPKMVGPEGRDSPSPIGPLLIWQQPHPIFYAELCYRAHRTRQTLERYRQIVFDTAEFMRCFAFLDPETRVYSLGPPVIPAQENHPPRQTWNPTFELAYWRFGLKLAQTWRARLGLTPDQGWAEVIAGLAPLPVRDGVYLAHENCPQTYTERNSDHPSMLAALGMLPGEQVDRETMRRTLLKVFKEWRWETTWGWDYPMTAMTAARLGEPNLAVEALLMETGKNRYLPNGHNWQRPNLPCYLPGNGGLLYAVAMMSAGWPGATNSPAPGFPSDGSWTVRWENLHSAL